MGSEDLIPVLHPGKTWSRSQTIFYSQPLKMSIRKGLFFVKKRVLQKCQEYFQFVMNIAKENQRLGLGVWATKEAPGCASSYRSVPFHTHHCLPSPSRHGRTRLGPEVNQPLFVCLFPFFLTEFKFTEIDKAIHGIERNSVLPEASTTVIYHLCHADSGTVAFANDFWWKTMYAQYLFTEMLWSSCNKKK